MWRDVVGWNRLGRYGGIFTMARVGKGKSR